jgi:hypothetical protein
LDSDSEDDEEEKMQKMLDLDRPETLSDKYSSLYAFSMKIIPNNDVSFLLIDEIGCQFSYDYATFDG